MRDNTKMIARKIADDLAVAAYEVTCLVPREEVVGLTSQRRRDAYSVPFNIAEGASRSSKKDISNFSSRPRILK